MSKYRKEISLFHPFISMNFFFTIDVRQCKWKPRYYIITTYQHTTDFAKEKKKLDVAAFIPSFCLL